MHYAKYEAMHYEKVYCIEDVPLLSYVSMQTLGGHDHKLWPNEHLSSIDSAGPDPAVNSIHLSTFMSTLLMAAVPSNRRALDIIEGTKVKVILTPIIPLALPGLSNIFQLN